MRRRRGGMAPFTVGLIALVVIGIGCYLGFTKSIPFRSHFELTAAFRSSNDIKPNSPVRIAGVEVGRVTKVEPTAPGAASARVTMEIKDSGRPIHSDAQAKIRPRIFLEGNFFVDLYPGSASRPTLGDGDTIPASQTSTPVQFDQVLKALKRPTREAAQQTLGELSKAYDAGFAREFNASLEEQAPAFKFAAIVSEAMLGRRPHDLSGVVRDLGTVSQALDASPPRLKSFIENFDRFAASLAVERDNLQATVSELPRTLDAAGPAFDSLNAAFPSVRRFAVGALPGVRSSGPAIAALRPFVAQMRGLVSAGELRGLTADLRGATPGLVGLAEGSVPLLGQLRPLASCFTNVTVPWSRDTVPDDRFPASGPVYQEGVKWLPGLAGESRSGDANGQWFKVLGSGGVETVQLGQGLFGTSLFPILGVNPPKPASRPPLRSDVPCETQETPDLRTKAGAPPQRMKIDRNAPGVQARYAKAREVAILELREQLRKAGIDTPVLEEDATRVTVEGLARRAGNLGQLELLRSGKSFTAKNIREAGK
jgi:virulence factor Mce-like protein